MASLSNYDDTELLQRLKQDDKPAFEEIYNRYWADLFDTAYKRLKDQEQCCDIVQEVFIDLWNRRNKVKIETLAAYLHTAIRYQVLKLVAKEKTASHFFELFESMVVSPFAADNNIAEKELSQLAHAWLDSLPEKRREIFLLHFRDKLSTSEIAEKLGISQKTVQNQLGSAITGLRSKLHSVIFFLTV